MRLYGRYINRYSPRLIRTRICTARPRSHDPDRLNLSLAHQISSHPSEDQANDNILTPSMLTMAPIDEDEFIHDPLDLDRGQIRLIRLTRCTRSSIRCSLKIFHRLYCPKYQALSYVWGCATTLHNIFIDSKRFRIRTNLWLFLKQVADGYLVDGSESFRPKWPWIDQLCIDQSSVIERNHQVQQMKHIFSQADAVICWLGPSGSDTNTAMDFIRRSMQPGSHFVQSHHVIEGLKDLFDRSYWRRVWGARIRAGPVCSSNMRRTIYTLARLG